MSDVTRLLAAAGHRSASAMPNPDSTYWTVIRAAAAGSSADREELARWYMEVGRRFGELERRS